MRAQPLIAVRDVAASSRWYQELLGCESGHGGPEYERLVKDGDLVLQLHAWGAHDHPNLGDPDAAPHGYGVLLWVPDRRVRGSGRTGARARCRYHPGTVRESQCAASRVLDARSGRLRRRARQPGGRRPLIGHRGEQSARKTISFDVLDAQGRRRPD